jgi:hypothetical protein
MPSGWMTAPSVITPRSAKHPSFHSITSSARASSVGGTVRPSALAAVIRRSCYNKAHDLEHGFHTPALLGES